MDDPTPSPVASSVASPTITPEPSPNASEDAQLRHQLRTPLNQILGYTELLIEEAEGVGELHNVPDLRRIEQAGHRLLELLNQHFSDEGNQHPPQDSLPSPATIASPSLSASTPTPEPKRSLQGAGVQPNNTAVTPACILVVDDEPANRELLKRRLEHEGHSVTTAGGGTQALELMRAHAFDLVLLDALMPDMSGLEVLQQLHEDQQLSRLPVVVLSALDELSHVARCIELGAEDYLPKPFNPTILRARINASLEKKRLRDTEAQLFEQLRQGYDRLAALERWREDWTQMLVHDLRTPLTAILGALQTLTWVSQKTNVPSEMHDELVDISTQSAENMLALVNDLLDAAQLEAGTFKLDLVSVRVNDLVTETVAQMRPLALAKPIDLTLDVATRDEVQVRADAQKLARVLVNLIANAIKFTPPRGLVTVSTTLHNGAVRFLVRDTGEGIPPDAISLIFQKFGQVEAKRAGYTGGSGLGLTFCKMVVEAHGGTIHVASQIGEGSTFSFELPTA